MKAVRPSTLDHRRTARRLLTRLLCGSLLVSLAASAAEPGPELALPDFGDSSGSSITPLEEQRMGEEFMRTMRASVKIVEAPEASEYLQGLAQDFSLGSVLLLLRAIVLSYRLALPVTAALIAALVLAGQNAQLGLHQ